MKITPAQARAAAEILFPEDYASDRVKAILRTLDWMRQLDWDSTTAEIKTNRLAKEEEPENAVTTREAREYETKSRKGDSKAVMQRLSLHMKKQGMSMNRLAADLGISAPSLRQWLLGQYVPRPESLQRIQAYLDNLK